MERRRHATDPESERFRSRPPAVLLVKPNELASLPRLLADQIVSLLGEASSCPRHRRPLAKQLVIRTLTNSIFRARLSSHDRPDDAVDSLEKAAEIDPEFTVAAAKLAEAFVRKYALSGMRTGSNERIPCWSYHSD